MERDRKEVRELILDAGRKERVALVGDDQPLRACGPPCRAEVRGDPTQPCAVCQESFEKGGEQVLLSCSHMFHRYLIMLSAPF